MLMPMTSLILLQFDAEVRQGPANLDFELRKIRQAGFEDYRAEPLCCLGLIILQFTEHKFAINNDIKFWEINIRIPDCVFQNRPTFVLPSLPSPLRVQLAGNLAARRTYEFQLPETGLDPIDFISAHSHIPHPATNGSRPERRIRGAMAGMARGLKFDTCSAMCRM